MTTLALLLPLLLAGYSIFCAASLAVSHIGSSAYSQRPVSRWMGWILLAALAFLQVAHVAWLQAGWSWPAGMAYRVSLFLVAPSFYLFSRGLLTSDVVDRLTPWDGAHVLPVLIAFTLPAGIAQPLAFLVGAVYLLWLGRRLWALRAERVRVRTEALLLGVTLLIAFGVAAFGLLAPTWPDRRFFETYTCAIGLAFVLVQSALNLRPQLPTEVQEAAQAVYAHTTLAKVDGAAALARLAEVMTVERAYTDPELGLSSLADRLGLTGHQLSELLNTRLGKSFARYVRELRVEAAKAMLLAEPAASVMSVGLSVGFSAQSNFYEAFREIEGTTPGQYRKLRPKPLPNA